MIHGDEINLNLNLNLNLNQGTLSASSHHEQKETIIPHSAVQNFLHWHTGSDIMHVSLGSFLCMNRAYDYKISAADDFQLFLVTLSIQMSPLLSLYLFQQQQ
jgi:hypothetical protein